MSRKTQARRLADALINNPTEWQLWRSAAANEGLNNLLAELNTARSDLARAQAELERVKAQEKRYASALERIHNEFEQINGRECQRNCGRCAKCIARDALMPFPHAAMQAGKGSA